MKTRRARVSALAKINLGLKVLYRRADGYHELRTVFQTVSLADTLDLEFTPGRATTIGVDCAPAIPDNLVERAARLMVEAARVRGRIRIVLKKRIPLGAGLGGGSSDAAAVLLALPVLAGRRLPLSQLIRLAGELGSDVPFFLLGGRAIALGRGTELYPLPDAPPAAALILAPPIQVSTPEAYRALGRPAAGGLTPAAVQDIVSSFQSFAWGQFDASGQDPAGNDFEPVVLSKHRQLKRLKRQLRDAGAQAALLSGSGSALAGLFARLGEARAACHAFPIPAFPVSLVSRARYRALWWRRLGAHIAEKVWPPQSRYA